MGAIIVSSVKVYSMGLDHPPRYLGTFRKIRKQPRTPFLYGAFYHSRDGFVQYRVGNLCVEPGEWLVPVCVKVVSFEKELLQAFVEALETGPQLDILRLQPEQLIPYLNSTDSGTADLAKAALGS